MKNIKLKTVETITPMYPDGVIMIKEDTDVEYPIAIVPFPTGRIAKGMERQRQYAKLFATVPELLEKLQNYQKSPWQPVSQDNLPPVGCKFLVISDNKYIKDSYMRSKEYRDKFCKKVSDVTKRAVTTIWDDYGLPKIGRFEGTRWTHWMLIPKLEEE